MTKTKPQISILGCGWLGLPLAENLKALGYPVKGSTTREERIPMLYNKGITPYCIQADEEGLKGPAAEFLAESEILIIDIPPGIRKDPNRDFTKVIRQVAQAAKAAAVKHMLYISSTSVFPEEEREFSEKDHFEPDSPAGRQLKTAEEAITEALTGLNTILRFGGLIGEERHPIHFLSGRKNLHGGNHRINLIHRDDCIGLILSVITKGYWGHILHGVAPCHISKKAYYTEIAQQMQLTPPEYSEHDSTHQGKTISGKQTAQWLDYTYQKPIC